MRIVYLIPPSEGKRDGGTPNPLSRSFEYPLPIELMAACTERDLKCTGKRFAEAKKFNSEILTAPTLPAMERYDGVMYSAIGYETLSSDEKRLFDESVIVLSGLFWALRPADRIPNYKLPIEAKGLANYWKPRITELLAGMGDILFVDLLPLSYRKMVDWGRIGNYVTMDFVDEAGKRLRHDVKSVKGKWLRKAVEERIVNISQLHEKSGIAAAQIPGVLLISP